MRIPSAMGRSNRPPSLGRSAGARFTVIRPAGNAERELMGGPRRAFERGESGLELLETGPRALEHPRLGVELVPGHQIELAESLAQHRAEVALEVPLHAAQRRGHALEQAPCELIDAK